MSTFKEFRTYKVEIKKPGIIEYNSQGYYILYGSSNLPKKTPSTTEEMSFVFSIPGIGGRIGSEEKLVTSELLINQCQLGMDNVER